MAAGFDLRDDDDALLVARGAEPFTRADVRRAADALLADLTAHDVQRALVLSDDPVDLLRALDAAARKGADLYIAHTNIPAEHLGDILQRFAIQYRIGADEGPRAAEAGDVGSARVFMMTSGTTGRPKIASHTLDTLMSRVRSSVKGAGEGARWLLTYQPTGFAGIQVILTGMFTRGIIVAPDQRTPAGFYEAAKRWDVNQISATPTFWRSFLMAAPAGALKLRQITLGGEAADQATLDRVKAAFPEARVTHIYASTEAGVVFAVHDGLTGFPAAWLEQPVQGVELRLQDGFLHIKTPNVMAGYVTESAQPLLEGGWLATADRCEIVGDRVRVLGRDDATINVGGSKVYPLGVEQFLLSLPGVAEARVYGVPNPISGFLVGADVVLAEGEDPAVARPRILAAAREGLAQYQMPRVFKIVDSIKVAASGKKGS